MVHNLKTDSGYGLSPSSFVTCNITQTTICLRCVPHPYSTMTISHYLITASYIIREYALSRKYYRLNIITNTCSDSPKNMHWPVWQRSYWTVLISSDSASSLRVNTLSVALSTYLLYAYSLWFVNTYKTVNLKERKHITKI